MNNEMNNPGTEVQNTINTQNQEVAQEPVVTAMPQQPAPVSSVSMQSETPKKTTLSPIVIVAIIALIAYLVYFFLVK